MPTGYFLVRVISYDKANSGPPPAATAPRRCVSDAAQFNRTFNPLGGFRRADRAFEAGYHGAQRSPRLISSRAAASRMDTLVDERQFDDGRRPQHERIEIGKAHAAVDRIDGEGQRQPGVD